VRFLKARLAETNSPEERQKLIAKIIKIAPTVPVPEK
jgi:hypothetical protein